MNATKVIYDKNILDLMNSFENITRARLRDCIVEEDKLIFVVNVGELRRAIGMKAENVKRLYNTLKKKIKIVEFSEDMLTLISNFIHPLKIDRASVEDGVVTLESEDTKVKGLIIGRAAQNLRKLEEYIRRYFEVKEIKVV